MKRAVCLMILAGAFAAPAFSQYPTLVAGIGLEPVVLPDASGAPVLFWTMGAEGLFSLKTRLGENTSFSLFSKVRGGLLLDRPFSWFDAEIASAELAVSTGLGRLTFKALCNSSFLGTMTEEIVYHPEWEARYYFLTESGFVNPYLAYSGFARIRPESDTDVFAEGGTLGIEYRPSYLEEYAIGVRGRWEHWYEQSLFLAGGLPSGSPRNDFLGELVLKGGWIIGLFLDCDVELVLSLRFSDANAYLTAYTYLNENSESAFTVSLLPSFDWSPARQIALKVKPLASYTAYFNRLAVTSGSLLSVPAFVAAAGGSLEFDWAPGDVFHVFVRAGGEWRYSNDDELGEWKFEGAAGLKFSFDFPPAGE